MGKNQSASNLTNVIQVSSTGNVLFVSGSTTLMSISSSGAITTTGVISGSNALSASYALNAGLLNNLGSGEFVATGSFNTFSSSILTYTGSANSRLGSIETITGSNITRISALEVTSGSNITRLNSIEVVTGSNISRLNSIETVTGSNITRLNSIEIVTGSLYSYTSSLNLKTASFATTGSNNFIGTQTISGSVLQSGSFTTTGTIIAQTINVQTVTSSIVYSSGSNIFGNLISNTQVLTGSVLITGSLALAGAATFSNNVITTGTLAATGIFSNGDSTTTAPNQFQISGVANTNKQLLIGYNTSGSGYGSIQAIFQGVGYTNLTLNPSGGNVGIGITNPAYKLHVVGGSFIGRQNNYGSYDSADADLIISNYNSDNTSILLYNQAGAYHSGLVNYYNNILSLGLNNSNSANSILTSTAINITCTGVGIGVTNPSVNLQVQAAAYPEIRVTDGTIGYQMYSGTGASDFVVGTYTNHNLVFRTNQVQRLSIASTGAATFSSTITASNLSGTNTGDQTLAGLGGVAGNSAILSDANAANVTSVGGYFTGFNPTNIPSGQSSGDWGLMTFPLWTGNGSGERYSVQLAANLDQNDNIYIRKFFNFTTPYRTAWHNLLNSSNFSAYALPLSGGTLTGALTGTTIYGSTAVCSPVGKFTSCIDAGTGYFSGNINANNISTTGRTMTGSPVSTGLSINGGSGGRTYLLLTSQQWDAGNSTSSAITMIRSGYDGNNFTACVLSSSNIPTETWSQSGGILHVTGNTNYQMDITVLNNS